MNQKQWKTHIKNKDYVSTDFWKWRNLAVEYFNLKPGYVIHHLRNTEEQCKFNDMYYERWGFDLNNQMKYAVCITVAEHRKIHKAALDTRQRMSESAKNRKRGAPVKGRVVYNNGKIRIMLKPGMPIPEGFIKGMLVTEKMKGHHPTKESIKKQWDTKRRLGTDKKSVETRKKMSDAAKRYKKTPEHLQHIREGAIKRRGKVPWNKGLKMSKEFCKKVSERTKIAMQKINERKINND